jgi:hypothetical protein
VWNENAIPDTAVDHLNAHTVWLVGGRDIWKEEVNYMRFINSVANLLIFIIYRSKIPLV